MKIVIVFFVLILLVVLNESKNSEIHQVIDSRPEAGKTENKILNIAEKKSVDTEDLKQIDRRLSMYSDFSFDELTAAQLQEFNTLVVKRAELIKKSIFQKFKSKYQVGRL